MSADTAYGLKNLAAGSLARYAERLGQVNFTRQDGPVTIAISSQLSDAAAKKLDTFLRELIAEDAAILEALQERHRSEMATMQRDFAERAGRVPMPGAL